MAVAYQWASRIMTVALEMVLPGVAGRWLDQRLGTVLVFTVVGFVAGMGVGMWHLIRMAGAGGESDDPGRRRNE